MTQGLQVHLSERCEHSSLLTRSPAQVCFLPAHPMFLEPASPKRSLGLSLAWVSGASHVSPPM